jgi:glutamate synthase (NADPH) large chain
MSTANEQGLYREAYEKDSCGFGLIANLDDKPSHWLVKTAIASLNRLTHRGAVAADGKTGDGCGLLLKKPEKFLRAVAKEAGFKLAPLFAAGNVFLNPDATLASLAKNELAAQLQREGLKLAGWRKLPTNTAACGAEALKTLPVIEQVFVSAAADIDAAEFNRKLFMARRRAEKALATDPVFYLPSLSAETIVYKGMVMPSHLAEFFPGGVLPRPRRPARGSFGRGVPPALLHQHAAAVAAGASLPDAGAQRRDQHRRGQPQLGGGPWSGIEDAAAA